jgi:glycosyltransferase XagB
MTAQLLRQRIPALGPLVLTQAVVPIAPAKPKADGLALHLLRSGAISSENLVTALALNRERQGRLTDVLLARGMISEAAFYNAMADHLGQRLVDPTQSLPDPRLIDRYGAARCRAHGLLPFANAGSITVILVADPDDFARHKTSLTHTFGPISMGLATPTKIEAALLHLRGQTLAELAENRVPLAESCRNWRFGAIGPRMTLALAAFGTLLWFAPRTVLMLASLWAIVTLLLSTALKTAAAIAALRPTPPEPPAPIIARLPIVSVIVALYREGDIAGRLIKRLEKLDYPRDLLDVVLAVEADDTVTFKALAKANLPKWMRVISVPDGQVRTKPRALNVALDHCRGSIVGVYDAEDAPDPDQIRKVITRFHMRGPEVACLQGILDFYNPHTNWLSRCFTIEYATWFRLMLPGLQRLGVAIPLGGTTLFFRRAVLEKLGGWDAHNVTEDADLGIRLARHGYRTEVIQTTTGEEANCRPLAWVKQRSRWLKGYMVTYGVHMRDPGLLWRQLGPLKFFGFQIMFLCTLSQALLVPVLWSFWALPLGLPHPVGDLLPTGIVVGTFWLFLMTEVITITTGIIALRRTSHRLSLLWVPTLQFYYPLAALASYKALLELVTKPFYWDKTSHGIFDH